MTTSAPLVLLLRDGPGDLGAAGAAMRLAGWAPAGDGSVGVGQDFRPPDGRAFVQGIVDDEARAGSMLMAVAAGYGAIAVSVSPGEVWTRFVRAVDELADARRWETTRLAGLDEAQIELLAAIGRGERVPDAARAAAVSERSAHRLLFGARTQLGARSNTHAASILVAEVGRLG